MVELPSSKTHDQDPNGTKSRAVALNVIRAPAVKSNWIRALLLRLYRLAVLAVIVFIMHRHDARLLIDGDAPISLEEVRPFFPTVAKLAPDESPRRGLFVLNGAGNWIGYILRTSPVSDSIIGYAGPTDTLVALNLDMRVTGVAIR